MDGDCAARGAVEAIAPATARKTAASARIGKSLGLGSLIALVLFGLIEARPPSIRPRCCTLLA
jgi:hypothetical protein